MKILVMSDSHSALAYMRRCIEATMPDAMIHLGDHYDDAIAISEEYPDIPMYHVPGNCDRYRCPPNVMEVQLATLDGVRLFLTHGHLQKVKHYISQLLADGRRARAHAVLYGHTHVPNCYQEPDGLWVLNPGSCGYYGGTVGLIETEPGRIRSCRVLGEQDL